MFKYFLLKNKWLLIDKRQTSTMIEVINVEKIAAGVGWVVRVLNCDPFQI